MSTAITDALLDLRYRLMEAEKRLSAITDEPERISGKAEGVRLAIRYIDEALRAA